MQANEFSNSKIDISKPKGEETDENYNKTCPCRTCEPGAYMVCAFADRGSRCANPRWRLSRGQHGGGPERPIEPYHWDIQYGSWFVFTRERHYRQLQHRPWRRNPPRQHRRPKHGHWRWSAFKQHYRRPKYCPRSVRSL